MFSSLMFAIPSSVVECVMYTTAGHFGNAPPTSFTQHRTSFTRVCGRANKRRSTQSASTYFLSLSSPKPVQCIVTARSSPSSS